MYVSQIDFLGHETVIIKVAAMNYLSVYELITTRAHA